MLSKLFKKNKGKDKKVLNSILIKLFIVAMVVVPMIALSTSKASAEKAVSDTFKCTESTYCFDAYTKEDGNSGCAWLCDDTCMFTSPPCVNPGPKEEALPALVGMGSWSSPSLATPTMTSYDLFTKIETLVNFYRDISNKNGFGIALGGVYEDYNNQATVTAGSGGTCTYSECYKSCNENATKSYAAKCIGNTCTCFEKSAIATVGVGNWISGVLNLGAPALSITASDVRNNNNVSACRAQYCSPNPCENGGECLRASGYTEDSTNCACVQGASSVSTVGIGNWISTLSQAINSEMYENGPVEGLYEANEVASSDVKKKLETIREKQGEKNEAQTSIMIGGGTTIPKTFRNSRYTNKPVMLADGNGEIIMMIEGEDSSELVPYYVKSVDDVRFLVSIFPNEDFDGDGYSNSSEAGYGYNPIGAGSFDMTSFAKGAKGVSAMTYCNYFLCSNDIPVVNIIE